MLLFNGHTAPVFVEQLWLMNDEGRHFGPTFMINEIVNENSIKEIVSPPFRNDDTAGESWEFPNDYRAGVIQSLDTNWARLESGWEDEKWENGDPVFVKARVSYKFGEKRLISSAVVWQGFSGALGTSLAITFRSTLGEASSRPMLTPFPRVATPPASPSAKGSLRCQTCLSLLL